MRGPLQTWSGRSDHIPITTNLHLSVRCFPCLDNTSRYRSHYNTMGKWNVWHCVAIFHLVIPGIFHKTESPRYVYAWFWCNLIVWFHGNVLSLLFTVVYMQTLLIRYFNMDSRKSCRNPTVLVSVWTFHFHYRLIRLWWAQSPIYVSVNTNI